MMSVKRIQSSVALELCRSHCLVASMTVIGDELVDPLASRT